MFTYTPNAQLTQKSGSGKLFNKGRQVRYTGGQSAKTNRLKGQDRGKRELKLKTQKGLHKE